MEMTYSYKPVLVMAMLSNADSNGRAKLSDIVLYFRKYYSNRRNTGLIVEKSNSLYCRTDVTDKQIERNILLKPFRRFEEMHMMRHTKTIGIVEMDSSVWKRLTEKEKEEILGICQEKLEAYYCELPEKLSLE